MKTFAGVAQEAVESRLGASAPTTARQPGIRRGLLAGILSTIRAEGPRHLALAFGALVLSILVGLPLGIVASGGRFLGRAILGTAGVLQTIPSLALLCFFIPLLGTGPLPALCALFLYGLLPIFENALTGLTTLAPDVTEAARGVGMTGLQRLLRVEMPLALPVILAGIRFSVVVSIATATIGSTVAAHTLGEVIIAGLTTDNTAWVLQGGLVVAVLAVLVYDGLAALERRLTVRTGRAG